MKINNKIFGLMGVIGLLFASCSSDEDLTSTFHNDTNAVRITAEVGKTSVDGFSRSNPLGTTEEQKKFNDGDEISVTAEGQVPVTYKLNGTEWQPQGDNYLKWVKSTMEFKAYYPATYNGTATQPTDYSTLEKLAAADFMSCTGSYSNSDSHQVDFIMNRDMARVVVETVFNTQYDVNTPVNSVTVFGNVKAYKHSDGKFYALVVPCGNQPDQQFLSLNVGENNTVETVKGIPALEAGKSYLCHIVVGKNKIEASDITVADWNTGEILSGGDATLTPYLTFTADAPQTFKMTTVIPNPKFDYTITGIEYSVGGEKWDKVEKDKEVEFGGDKGILYLRGQNKYGTADPERPLYRAQIIFTKDVPVACKGDIRMLLDYNNSKNVDTSNARFLGLFCGCTVLTSAPELPAENLANYCYANMFWDCAALETAPALPAENLADRCYEQMFSGCKSLTAAPELPAKKMTELCYNGMFDGCTSLTTAPLLPATTLAYACYQYMFKNCGKLSSVTMLAPSSEISSSDYCVKGWLEKAGNDASVTSRTLKVKDQAAYKAILRVENGLDDNWKVGKCNVLDENGNKITE